MAPRRPPGTTPDLFATPRAARPAGGGNAQPPAVVTKTAAAATRYVLPESLALALRTMEDAEFDRLLASVTAEARRRGRMPEAPERKKPAAVEILQPKPNGLGAARPGSLTTGQTNAVRAAFRAGVKLSAIARQFGLSPAQVKKALGQG